jgi:hypothetical protein
MSQMPGAGDVTAQILFTVLLSIRRGKFISSSNEHNIANAFNRA